MKLVSFDLDALMERRERLVADLTRIGGQIDAIDTLISVMHETQMHETPVVPTVPVVTLQPPPPDNQMTEEPVNHHPVRKGRQRSGMRKAMSLHLHTGPCKEDDLMRALGWNVQDTHTVLMGMRNEEYASLDMQTNRWTLTQKGRRMAKWFIDHPQFTFYVPTLTGDTR